MFESDTGGSAGSSVAWGKARPLDKLDQPCALGVV